MPDGFDEVFAEVSAELGGDTGGSSGGDLTEDFGPITPNANVHMGDDDVDVSDETSLDDDTDVSDGGNVDTGNTPGDGISDGVFDYTAYADRLVEVTVDGEVVRVPLKEAMSGFMRQSDYTRKTQSLAEERKLAEWGREMQQAFQNDPTGTLRALNDAFGYVPPGVGPDGGEEIDPELAPIFQTVQAQEAQMRQMQAQLARVQQERVLNEVKAEMAEVKSRYDDFDASKVLPLAAERGLSIEDAYLLHKSKELIGAQRDAKAAQERAAALAAAEAAKREQAARVQSRSSGVSADSDDGELPDFDSFGEMFDFQLKKSRNR